ncbi:dienelactone hydrolase family protein [Fulvivirga sp. 29W222]|uniref:Dienelactone hydrolase family protein n=1 Tax=Fulvivirga marina TaxID=2494733 RepID=A0A937FXX5_9BACT|nr:dienelactone hydrolase family protein [Fulvivirga marina]MBL6448079.1 dienelactone hydrolase family protein [Fulvivirga marina]
MKATITENFKREVQIPIKNVTLSGELIIPKGATGLVIFSHGSGSSRFSPRNNKVADTIRESNVATLLFDLLTEQEDAVYDNRFNIGLLTNRLISVTHWVMSQQETKHLNIGYFGASTGAASALNAAATELGKEIKAVVSRGGRPDLSLPVLEFVKAPVLLIVGGNDIEVIKLNQLAYKKLKCEKELKIIPGATHLFEERGALEEVAHTSAIWFKKHLK